MNDKAKKIIGGAIALAGAFMAFSNNKEEKKSNTETASDSTSTGGSESEITSEPTEKEE